MNGTLIRSPFLGQANCQSQINGIRLAKAFLVATLSETVYSASGPSSGAGQSNRRARLASETFASWFFAVKLNLLAGAVCDVWKPGFKANVRMSAAVRISSDAFGSLD